MLKLTLLLLGCLTLSTHAKQAFQTEKVVMVISDEEQNIELGFREYLKQRVPVTIKVIRFSGHSKDIPALITQVREEQPKLIYARGSVAMALAGPYDDVNSSQFIRDIPIVFSEISNPLALRLLEKLNPPGRNVTGVIHVPPLVTQFKTMSGYRAFKRLGYITNSKELSSVNQLAALRKLAPSLGIEIVNETIPMNAAGNPDSRSLPAIVRRLVEQKVELLYIGSSTFLALTHRDLVTQSALKSNLPTFCVTEAILRHSKCMFGLFSDGRNIGQFAAFKATQVLVDNIPIGLINTEAIPRFSLLINISVAKALELYPPISLLEGAEVMGGD